MEKSYEIISGDALTVLGSLPAHTYDALITDPPYSTMSTSGGNGKYFDGACADSVIAYDDMDQRVWGRWTLEWLRASRKCLKQGAPILIFASWRNIPGMTDLLQMASFKWQGIIPWDKVRSRVLLGRFRHQAEYIVWGSYGKLDTGHKRCLPGVYRVSNPLFSPKKRIHAMQKPVELLQQLVRIARDGGKILDPFCGSGTTLAAAVLEGYTATGIEIDPEMAAKADQRVHDLIGV